MEICCVLLLTAEHSFVITPSSCGTQFCNHSKFLQYQFPQGLVANAACDLRPLSLDDFIESKAKVSPSVSYDATTMIELRKWNEQYGEGGSRTMSPFGF
ncbi:hypothetical protein F2Q69_00031020 [Brassica cretica]|uniref:Uncharacterized protein n=1 Tax=Brassica cretica TaxID=69181 RepID=A0A8S9RRT2_BRACR|nr:hypothetical protein F2Q69_00031020 [Brassica cretica]